MKLKHVMLCVLILSIVCIPLLGEEHPASMMQKKYRNFYPENLDLIREMQLRQEALTGVKSSGDHLNTTLIGRWANGPCYAVVVKGDTAYFRNGGYLEIVDFSDPANPVKLGKVVLPSFVIGVAVSGNYAYVADWGDEMTVSIVYFQSTNVLPV